MSEGLFKRAKSLLGRSEPEPAAVAPRKQPNRFHAVTIAPGRHACAEARALLDQRFLSRDAPPLPLKGRARLYRDGIDVWTPAARRIAPDMLSPRAKSHNYLNMIVAEQQVKAHDPEGWAVLLDANGNLAEGMGSNVFIVRDGRLYTPDLASCLDGITRDAVITMARDLGIPVIEKRITRDEMYCADEAFFTGTAAEVTPIRELDDRVIGEGRRGPVTERLQSLFFDVVAGRNDQYRHWLTLV